MKMQALVFTERNRCEVLTHELPDDLGPREVLVRNRLGLLSPGTELAVFTGSHRGFDVEDHWARYPYSPGYAALGIVEAVGERVHAFTPGDRVLHQGNHATIARQPADAVQAVPESLSDERALFLKLLGIALTPQLVAPLHLGEDALVVGLGLVGNLAAQVCREAGAFRVLGADRSAFRVELARRCGLVDARVVDPHLELEAWVAECTEHRGTPYVIEAVGSARALRSALDAVAANGRVVVLSSPREKIELDTYFDIHHRGVQLVGAHEWRRDRMARAPYDPFLVHLLAEERVVVDPLVTHHVAFGDEVQAAYEGLHDDPETWLGVVLEYPS